MEARYVLIDCQKAYSRARKALPDINGDVSDTTPEYRLKVKFIRSLADKLLTETLKISKSEYSGELCSLFKLISLALISQTSQVGLAGEFCSIVILELLKSAVPNRIEYIGLSGDNVLQTRSDYGMVVVNRASVFAREDDRLAHLHNWGESIIVAPHHPAPILRHGDELMASDIRPSHMTKLISMGVVIESRGAFGKAEWEKIREFMSEFATLVNKKFIKKHLAETKECEKLIVPNQLATAILSTLKQFIVFANEKIRESTSQLSRSQSSLLFKQQERNQDKSELSSQSRKPSLQLSTPYPL